MFRFLVFVSCLFAIDCGNGINRRREFNLTVSYAPNSSSIILINNQFPGPLIEAELNDILIIHVKNNLPSYEEMTIHFHGMLVRQTPQMDGVAYVTQIPIASGQYFTHVFRAYPAGTYFYHSHSGLDAVTAFGPLIVYEQRKRFNFPEVPCGPLLFSDQWLTSDRLTQEVNLLASPFQWIGEPTGLLINGQRNFVMTLEPNRKYLLRLIGSTSLSTIVFGIDQHPMTLVEVDGTLVKPKTNLNFIEIASGQRYVVIIQTKNQRQGVFVMKLAIRWRISPVNSSCTGLLRYGTVSSIPADLSTLPQPSLPSEIDLLASAWTNPSASALAVDSMPKHPADREYFLLNTQEHTSDGLGIRWVINNGTLDMARLMNLTTPLLFDLYHGNRGTLPTDVTYAVKPNELVDLVLQNTVALNGVCESHPFHFHGHKFWVHSHGTGSYNRSLSYPASSENPVLQDSMLLYATDYAYFTPNRNTSNHQKPCGWAKLRFIADNPGLWMLHCHIGSHSFMGMNVLVEESIDQLSMQYLAQHEIFQ